MDGAALKKGRWFGMPLAMYHTAVFCVGRQILVVNMVRKSGLFAELHPGVPKVSLLHCR